MGRREYYSDEDNLLDTEDEFAQADKYECIKDWKRIKALAADKSRAFYDEVANREANKRKLVIYRGNK